MSTEQTSDAVPETADSARLLIIGGILLVVAGMIFGDLYAVFILHPNIADIGREFAAAVNAAAANNADAVVTHFTAVGGFLENAGTKKDSHVHIIHAGYLALLLAFLQPYVRFSDGLKAFLAQIFLAAAVVFPIAIFLIHYIGLVYSPLTSIGWASIFADLSGLVLILVVLMQLLGFGLNLFGHRTNKASLGFAAANRESRILLAGGGLLILAGFLFGAYYAGFELERNEARETSILTAAMQAAAAKDASAIGDSLASYGALQGERAVKIAAHAHVIEFGLLGIMLAFAQPHVFLAAVWRRRLVTWFLLGATVLPVAVFAEQWFGLIAGGVADTAGLLVIIAVSGMLGGVIRDTGRVDAVRGESR